MCGVKCFDFFVLCWLLLEFVLLELVKGFVVVEC